MNQSINQQQYYSVEELDSETWDLLFSDNEDCDDQQLFNIDFKECNQSPQILEEINFNKNTQVTSSTVRKPNHMISNPSNQTTYIKSLLNHPQMTPSQLSLILNYKQSHPPDTIQSETEEDPITKKRRRKPLTMDYKQRRNSRRRFFYRFRGIITDFPKLFIQMASNVFNLGNDIKLFQSFVMKYFHENMMYTKTLKSSDYYSKKYCVSGRQHFYEIMQLAYQTSPDTVFIIEGNQFKYNPQTKQTMVISKVKHFCTRTMIITSLFTQVMMKLQGLVHSFVSYSSSSTGATSSYLGPSSIGASSPYVTSTKQSRIDKEIFIKHEPNLPPLEQHPSLCDQLIDLDQDDPNTVDYQSNLTHQNRIYETQILEPNEISHMLNPFINQLSTSNTQISLSFSQLFANINLYSAIQQMITQPNNVLVSLLAWFPSGIKVETEYIHVFYINEQQRIVQLDLFFESIKLEISNRPF